MLASLDATFPPGHGSPTLTLMDPPPIRSVHPSHPQPKYSEHAERTGGKAHTQQQGSPASAPLPTATTTTTTTPPLVATETPQKTAHSTSPHRVLLQQQQGHTPLHFSSHSASSTSTFRPTASHSSSRLHSPSPPRPPSPPSQQQQHPPSFHSANGKTSSPFRPTTPPSPPPTPPPQRPRFASHDSYNSGYTSMDDGYSSHGGYSSFGGYSSAGFWSSAYSSSPGARKRATPPSSPRSKRGYYGDRKHARQYLKNTQRIHTTYTPYSLVFHVGLILYRIIILLCTPSPFQIVSFTHLVYLTDTTFHAISLAWHLLRFPKLERITVIYGTWVVWIGWGLAIWLSDPDMRLHQQEQRAAFGIDYNRLDPAATPDLDEHLRSALPLSPFLKKYNSLYVLYLPVISFLGLLLFRRNLWGLISWEHLTRMDQIGQLKYYRAWCLSGVGAGWALAWKICRWWFHVPYMPMDDPMFCQYAAGKSCLEASLDVTSKGGGLSAAQYRTDVVEFRFWPMLVSNLVMGVIMMCWWSFWTFQYQGVVWREDLKEGWAVWRTTTGAVTTGLVTDGETIRKSVRNWRHASHLDAMAERLEREQQHQQHHQQEQKPKEDGQQAGSYPPSGNSDPWATPTSSSSPAPAAENGQSSSSHSAGFVPSQV